MQNKGTCLIAYVPLRSEPRSGAEMVSSLIFGESYTIIEQQDGWLKVKCDYDQYQGWMSKGSHSAFREMPEITDSLYLEAPGYHQKLLIPCGGQIPEGMQIEVDGHVYDIKRKLKTNHHLPQRMRILKTAQMFINSPYLWGGRTYMGIDCSGFMQVVFKANGIFLPRDTSQQIQIGKSITFGEQEAGDLVFFSQPGKTNVSHVGLLMEKHKVIHASGKVQETELSQEGMHMNGELSYALIGIKRVL
ncbi:MAG: NlpC/P60 family protein [Chitinophagaceae bacterium]